MSAVIHRWCVHHVQSTFIKKMNTENESNSSPKKNYKQLHRILKSKCEDISKVLTKSSFKKLLFINLVICVIAYRKTKL